MKFFPVVTIALLLCVSAVFPQKLSSFKDRNEWIATVIKKTSEIKPGMIRGDLLEVFKEEGGISTAFSRVYAYKDCPYIKVLVEFSPVGRPERDSNGRATLVENSRDVIKSISKPYLEFAIVD
jgi:hypothetical protein